MNEVFIIWTNEHASTDIFIESVDKYEFEKLILCAAKFTDTCDNGAYLEPLNWLSDWLIDKQPLKYLPIESMKDSYSKVHFRRTWIFVCGDRTPNLVPEEAL